MDIDMDRNHVESEENLRRKRIQVYKSILNYYRGRSLSLGIILASKQQDIDIPPDLRTLNELRKNIQGFLDDIVLIGSLRNCLKLVRCSLASNEVMSLNDFYIRRENINKIDGIIYFSKSIMKLYNECYNELHLINQQKKYFSALTEYGENLDALQQTQKETDSEDVNSIEKAELQVYKINLSRALKSTLIGFITANHPDLLPQVHQFRSPVRRNLTIDDFSDAWDIGLQS